MKIIKQFIAVFILHLSLIMLPNIAHADSEGGMLVYYVHKKNGSHIGYQVWKGTRTEDKELSSVITKMIKDQYGLDSVTVAPVYPNRCGVLYSEQTKDGKTKYYSSEYHKSLEEAKRIAKDRSENKYMDYKILEVACSPSLAELQAQAQSDGSVICSDSSIVKYKYIIPPRPNKRMAVMLRAGDTNIVFSEKDLKNINREKIASSICPGEARPTTSLDAIGVYIREFIHENCIEKHGSEKACLAWKRRQYKNQTYLSGVRG